MQPTYVRKLKQQKPTKCTKKQFTDDSIEELNSSFDHTDWNIFIEACDNPDEIVDTISEYINFNIDMIIPEKEVKLYPNNKPWINSSLRKQIVETHEMYTSNDPEYEAKLIEITTSITKAKLEYKDKIESLLKQNKSKEAWKGLNIITGRDKAKKDSELLRKPGSADRLNSFYARFDDKDFSDEHSALRNDLQGRMKDLPPITVDTS